MGHNRHSMGSHVIDDNMMIHKKEESDIVIALAGNPNVGKSTVFNALTGLHQHTGNWIGKTVSSAQGYRKERNQGYVIVDIPGCYSLSPHSGEEEVAGKFLYSDKADLIVVVCDASCLERNMILVLEILDLTERVIVCVNLIDEAEKKKITINCKGLKERLGVPVIPAVARKGEGMEELLLEARQMVRSPGSRQQREWENACRFREDQTRWQSRSFGADKNILRSAECEACSKLTESHGRCEACSSGMSHPLEPGKSCNECERNLCCGFCREQYELNTKKREEERIEFYIHRAEQICRGMITYGDLFYTQKDRNKDRLFTGKLTGIPMMILLLLFLFWLTIAGANYASDFLQNFLFKGEAFFTRLLMKAAVPTALTDLLMKGIYRVSAWVIAVMLPPMAIFFPLFTLLEDSGYLPRAAYNLDKCFQKCSACGKQCLTMAMGLGCNAAGVVGCRIIDSPRERLIAILTNCLMPCNGRFPMLILLCSMLFAVGAESMFGGALVMTGVLLLGVLATFAVSRFLSATVLKGIPSSFTLELPPYRRPQIGSVLLRSVTDRVLFVLGRAVISAIPAGALIWLGANIMIGDQSLLTQLAAFFDPFGRLLGMDGVILLAFLIGLPANELVIPLIVMIYLGTGSLQQMGDSTAIQGLFAAHGWTWVTAVSTILFALIHWPCATTGITIYKETGSLKWTGLAYLIPGVLGMVLCFLFTSFARLVFGA